MSSLATRIAAVVDALFPRKKRNVFVVKTKRFAHASLKEKQKNDKNDWQKRLDEAERKDTTSSPEFSSLSLRREQRQREETKMIATSSRSSSAVSTNTSRSSSKFVTSKKTSNTLRRTRNRHNNSKRISKSVWPLFACAEICTISNTFAGLPCYYPTKRDVFHPIDIIIIPIS